MDSSKRKVKSSKVTPPKVRIPGPNSWANEKAASRKMKVDNSGRGHVLSRDKLENKPMPPTPEASPSEKTMTVQKKKGYIQPATPLVKPIQRGRNVQRAVTDPVIPQPLLANTTADATQLRKKRSQANLNPKASNEESTMPGRSDSPIPVFSEKASKILGVLPAKDYRHVAPPVSAPPSTKTPDPSCGSTEGTEDRGLSPSRQVQLTPVPTRRYMRENNLQTPEFNFAFPETELSNADRQQTETRGNLPVFGDAMGQGGAQISTFGSCGRLGEVKYVNPNMMQRVPSFAGIIEDACQPCLPEAIQDEQKHAPTGTNPNEPNTHPQSSAEILKPVAYSPGSLAGVWENNPHVVSRNLVNQGITHLYCFRATPSLLSVHYIKRTSQCPHLALRSNRTRTKWCRSCYVGLTMNPVMALGMFPPYALRTHGLKAPMGHRASQNHCLPQPGHLDLQVMEMPCHRHLTISLVFNHMDKYHQA